MQAFKPIKRSLVIGLALAYPGFAHAQLPSGGTLVGGSANYGQTDAQHQVINQSSSKAIIDWQSFSIGAGNSVRINQPDSSSVLLNRVTGNQASTILGSMSANGQVFLVNPYGVYFGAGASVDVAGLLATTMKIRNDDFMAGRYVFSSDNASSIRREVINAGVLKAREGGYVVLAGDYAANSGIIQAKLGTAVLASGSKMTVDIKGDSLINFAVNEKTLADLSGVDNSGQMLADGGRAIMTAAVARDLATAAVNNSGLIQAQTMVEREGGIYLSANGGNTLVSGTLDASGKAAGQKGGRIDVLGDKVALVDAATLDASGDAGGGTVHVGGSFQGNGPLPNARTAYVGKDAQIRADALNNGNGGQVVVWADEQTRYYGNISAKGGAQSGDGGNVEVSGKAVLDFNGSVNTLAANGKAGNLLLDPADITISNAADSDISTTSPFGDLSNNGGTSVLKVSTLQNALANGNVTVTTSTSSGTAPNGGTITVDDSISWSTVNQLQLKADNRIQLNANVSGAAGTLWLDAANGATQKAGTTITAKSLLLTGAGNWDLGGFGAGSAPTSFNEVGTLAANLNGGLLRFSNNRSFTVGSVSGTNGINQANGDTRLYLQRNSGTLTLAQNINTGTLAIDAVNGAAQNASTTITANSLLLTGGGNWDLGGFGAGSTPTSFNGVGTLAANLNGGLLRFSNNKSLTVGAVNGTNGINHANGDSRLYLNGALTLAQGIDSGSIFIRASGGTTQTGGSIRASNLALTGGAVNLNQVGNQVGTIAADINGAFSFTNAGALTVGDPYGVKGIKTGNHNVTIRTGDAAGYDPEKLPDGSTNPASLTLNQSIDAGSAGISLIAGSGGVYQRRDMDSATGKPKVEGSLIASTLLLQGNNPNSVVPFVLNNANNRVGVLAARTNGSISYAGGSLTIASIGGVSGITTTSNTIVKPAGVNASGQPTPDIYNDNNVSLSIGGNIWINENINAAASNGTNSVTIGMGGDFTASTAAGKRINANSLGVVGDDMQGTFQLTTNVASLSAGGGKLMVIDNSAYTGNLTGLGLGASAGSATAPSGSGSVTVSGSDKPIGDFYLTTGGGLSIIKLNSKGKNLLLRSNSLDIVLDATTADGARIMLQPYNLSNRVGVNNANESGFNADTHYSGDTLLKFKNPTATFFIGTPQNVILNDSSVDAAAKNTLTGDMHIGADGAFNLGYRSLSAQTSGNMVAYSVGPLYNLRLAAPKLDLYSFDTFGNQIHLFSNNLRLLGTALDYKNPNKPEITLRSLDDNTVWIGNGLDNKPYEPHFLSADIVKLPDYSTIIISGSTDFPFPSGGPGNGDIHIPWNDSFGAKLGNRKLLLSTGNKIYTYSNTPTFTKKEDGGKSGGLWQGCQDLAGCQGTNPSPYPDPTPPDGGDNGDTDGPGSPGNPGKPGGSDCAGCPPAPPDTNPYPPATTTPGNGSGNNGSGSGLPGNGTGSDGDGGGDGGAGDDGGGAGDNGAGDGSGDPGGGGNGAGNDTGGDGDGDGGAGNGDGGVGDGSNGAGDGGGDGGANTGGGGDGDNGAGNGSGGAGDGDTGTGDGGAGNGDNGAGDGGAGNGDGSNGAGDGGGDGGASTGGGGDGDNGAGNGSGGAGGGDAGTGIGDGGAGNGDNDAGNGSGGAGDGGAGNGSGGAGDGSGNAGDGGGDNGVNPAGGGTGDGGADNGSGGTADGDAGMGNGANAGGNAGAGDGDAGSGDGGAGTASGGHADGGADSGNGSGDQPNAFAPSSVDVSCGDISAARKEERASDQPNKGLVEIRNAGLKLQDPCAKQPEQGSSR
ncbi:filamentous hemagglutinin N-terminal domain-containing protein [Noviherbaspirillum cavernae]|uniref:two-partner secretion domain-containing protein n=1 Tax=Noviherbaspirillum cavernae TaxID=2320862 RepID=UPI0011C3D481|nr:filamentous hemagglutinin N-terminal domain-containing protein [Noviherbaspirillum cavernae]